MIDTPAARTQRLIEAWGRVTAASDRAEADPLVQDCARRLLADPGGGTAYLWTFGLVQMAGYLAGSRDRKPPGALWTRCAPSNGRWGIRPAPTPPTPTRAP